MSVLQWALDRADEGLLVAIASVITTSGSVPGQVGARLAICSDGSRKGTVGGAGLEHGIELRLKKRISERNRQGEVETFLLSNGSKKEGAISLNSLCGGRVTIVMESLFPTPRVLLMGAGHVGQAIAALCDNLDWSYIVADVRQEFVEKSPFKSAEGAWAGDVNELISAFDSYPNRISHALLLGHDWSIDESLLIALLKRSSKEEPSLRTDIGVIGSRAKWKAFRETALEHGISEDVIDQTRCPIGLSLGAETPAEIAIAVCAEILSNFKGVNPLDSDWRSRLIQSGLDP